MPGNATSARVINLSSSPQLSSVAYVDLLALSAKEREDLDRFHRAAGHAVRRGCVEFGCLSCTKNSELCADLQVQRPGKYEEPFVADMDAVGDGGIELTSRAYDLEGLDSDRPGRKRDEDHSVASHGLGMHARVARCGSADELVERYVKDAGNLQQHIETRIAKPRLQPRQDADRDSRALAHIREPEPSPRAQLLHPRANPVDHGIKILMIHVSKPAQRLQYPQISLRLRLSSRRLDR